MRGSAPVMAKSPNSRNAWLTTQRRRTGLGAEFRAGLTKPAIVDAAAKLIESAGVIGFSLRKLAKVLGVGPTTIHFHFKGAGGGIYAAIVVRALGRSDPTV
jgi:AcrR family transcriptional regulator